MLNLSKRSNASWARQLHDKPLHFALQNGTYVATYGTEIAVQAAELKTTEWKGACEETKEEEIENVACDAPTPSFNASRTFYTFSIDADDDFKMTLEYHDTAHEDYVPSTSTTSTPQPPAALPTTEPPASSASSSSPPPPPPSWYKCSGGAYPLSHPTTGSRNG